jgi:hypothetical protein
VCAQDTKRGNFRLAPKPKQGQPDKFDPTKPSHAEFKTFLVGHVKANASKTDWNKSVLDAAYQAAHPTHHGYTAYIGKRIDGRYKYGAAFTVEDILHEAFPEMSAEEVKARIYVREYHADRGASKPKKTKQWTRNS